MTDLPEIAFLCMVWNPMFRCIQPFEVWDQDYPNELKVLYLLNQEPRGAKPIVTDLPIRIVETTIEGAWPWAWCRKVESFLSVVKEPIMVWWDEDDFREHQYVMKAVSALLEKGADFAYNIWNEDIKSSSILLAECSVGSGTMVAKTEVFREEWIKFRKNFKREVYYQVSKRSSNPKKRSLPPKKHGPYPLDGPFFREGWSRSPRLVKHKGVRGYLWHSESTCPTHRKPGNAVDL